MGTKNNPGQFDCYAKAAPDEPIFILRSSDPIAPMLVELWADIVKLNGSQPDKKIQEALKCAEDMKKYKHQNKLFNNFSE